jgi:hypothetical protein
LVASNAGFDNVWVINKISASGGDLITDNIFWILSADRYCYNAVDSHMPKQLEDRMVGASKPRSAMA